MPERKDVFLIAVGAAGLVAVAYKANTKPQL
jgi:hypothetical protein